MNHSKRSPQPSKLLTLRILGLFVISVVLSLSVFFVLRREASKVEAVVGSLKIGGGTSVTTMSNETFYSQALRWGYNGTNTTDTYSIMYTNGTLGVGIGTTQPGAWVHIKDRSDSTPNMRLTSNTNGLGYDISLNGTSNYFSIKDNTSGNQRVTILPNGNVGINVQTPGTPLDIAGNTRTTGQFQSTVTTGTAPLTVASTTLVTNLNADLLDGQHGAYYLPLANVTGTVNQVPKFTGVNAVGNSTITDNGNVGIGSTVPGNKLDVGSATTHIVRSYGGYTGNAAANIGGTGAAAYFPSGLYANGTNNWLYGTTTHNGTVQDNASRWSINPAGTVYFNTGGNVGVGTTAPGNKVDIIGSLRVGVSRTFAGDGELDFSSGTGTKINFLPGYNKRISVDTNEVSISNLESGAWNTVTSMVVDTGATSRFRVLNDASTEHLTVMGATGNVGIGSTTPPYKLEVGGDVRANGGWLRTTGSYGWYNDSYGGGWTMSDSTWIRSYGNKSIYQNTGTLRTDGTLQVDSTGNTLTAVSGSGVGISYLNRYGTASNNPENGNWNPIWSAISSGRATFTDEEFALGTNGVAVYNNLGNGTVTHTWENGDGSQPNQSGKWIRINYSGGGASPGLGGFYQNITARRNATFIQRFRAKLPVGYTLVIAENSQGTNNTSYWATSTAGTGKWEEYIRVSHCGNTGTFSGGGHVYVTGTDAAFVWYLASSNVYEVNAPPGIFSGNVGIGTASPTQKLEVVGGHVNVGAGYGFHTATNDSWFPYTNGYNYFRGNTYAFNGTWYDENNTSYYLDLNNTSRFNKVAPIYVDLTQMGGMDLYNNRASLGQGLGWDTNAGRVEFLANNVGIRNPSDGIERFLMSTYTTNPYGSLSTYQIQAWSTLYAQGNAYLGSQGGNTYVGTIDMWGGAIGDLKVYGITTLGEDYYPYWDGVTPQVHITGNNMIQMGTYHIKPNPMFTIANSCSGNWLTQVIWGIYSKDYAGCGDEAMLALQVEDAGENSRFVLRVGNDANDDVFIRGTGGTTTGTGDLAEIYHSKDAVKLGEVVAQDPDYPAGVKRATKNDLNTLVGVTSAKPFALLMSQSEKKTKDEVNFKPITLAGKIIVRVSLENGPIKAGDALTISSTPGVAMKATKAGMIIGRAFENYDGSEQSSTGAETMLSDVSEDCPGCDAALRIYPKGAKVAPGTYKTGIMVLVVNVGWYDPDLKLTASGDLELKQTATGHEVRTTENTIVTRIGAFAELVVARIKAGVVETTKLIVNGVDVMQKLMETEQKLNDTQKTVVEQGKKIEELENALKTLQSK